MVIVQLQRILNHVVDVVESGAAVEVDDAAYLRCTLRADREAKIRCTIRAKPKDGNARLTSLDADCTACWRPRARPANTVPLEVRVALKTREEPRGMTGDDSGLLERRPASKIG
jgi:hypothetical protein